MKKLSNILFISALFFSCQPQKFDFIICNAIIYDGSGNASYKGDIGINADTIAFIGDLSKAIATTEFNANGLALSPGFIDSHSHHSRGMFEIRDMPSCVSQGITTIVVGQDGGSYFRCRIFSRRLRKHLLLSMWLLTRVIIHCEILLSLEITNAFAHQKKLNR